MSITVVQKPEDIQSAQSPIVFSVLESTQAYTSSEFQYTANLYIWSGNMNQSGSYVYQARKYPNPSGSGIFDFSKFINSTLTDLAATNPSNIKYYKAEFGWQYATGSTYVSQPGGLTPVTCSTGGTMFKAYDGYNLFPQQINTSLSASDSYWSFMTDMGSVTQSVLITDTTLISSTKGLNIWLGASDNFVPSKIACTASYENGTQASSSTALSTGSTSTSQQIGHLPSSPGDNGWPGYWPTTASLSTYKFNAYSGSVVVATLNYEVVCEQYYTPVRIAWKNRFGQFDWLNFYKRHNNTFNTDQRVYQPQLGTWQSQTLSYNQYQTAQQRYIVDATEVLDVNTNWLSDGYNEIMKQLMVSDEIYWLTDQTAGTVKPLTIKTNSLQFKTGVNNKLIQYTLSFDIGQPYKLLL
jgi:hypothetical protein